MATAIDSKPLKVLMVTSVWPSDTKPDLVPFLVEQVRSLKENGVEIEIFPFYGKANPIRYVWYWLVFHYKCLFNRYDLIHAQFGQSGIVAWPTSSPLVVTFHGSDLQGWVGSNGIYSRAGRLMQKMSAVVAQFACQIIVVSEHLLHYLPPDLSVNLIPCGIDLQLFHPMPQLEARKQLALPLDKFLILFVGDPSNPIKRFSLAQQAFELLKESLDAVLVVAMDIPHDQMPVYMNACDALALTSWHEGSPTVVKEALACNLPIVSVNVGDVYQRVGEIPGCIICADDSVRSVAEGLLHVARGGRLRNADSAVKNLSLDNVSKEIIKVYQAAIRGE